MSLQYKFIFNSEESLGECLTDKVYAIYNLHLNQNGWIFILFKRN